MLWQLRLTSTGYKKRTHSMHGALLHSPKRRSGEWVYFVRGGRQVIHDVACGEKASVWNDGTVPPMFTLSSVCVTLGKS